MRKKVLISVSLLLVALFALVACQPSVTPPSPEQTVGDNIESPTKTATKKLTTEQPAAFEPAISIGSTQIRFTDGMEQVYVPQVISYG